MSDDVGSNSAHLRPGVTRQRSSQESQTASLSTTPKQSHLGFQSFSAADPARAAPKAPDAAAPVWQQRSSSVAQPSAFRQSSSYLGETNEAGSALRTPQQRPTYGRDTSQSQRTVSYAPSDIDTVSGVSASEYSSGDDEPSRSVRGRYRDSNIRQSVSDGRAGLLDPSPAGRAGGTQKGRRPSSVNRETSKVRRPSQAPRDADYDDLPDDDQRYGPQDDEDDEVQPRDRGEQLVRRRMKERQREKALRKKAEKDRARQSTAYPQQPSNAPLLSPNLKPSSTNLGQRSISPSRQLDRSGRPTTILLPPSGMAGLQPSVVSPSFQQPLPSPSPGANKSVSGGYPSPHSHIRRTNSQQPSRQSFVSYGQQTSAGPRSSYNATTADNLSVAGRSHTEAGSSVAGSVHADDQEPGAGRNVDDDDDYADDIEDDQGTPDDDDDDEIDGDDVEYTLKDRQDAINIEHPFGLPIWKPALYKKSRSVTRNAEIALQSIPSAAAERHYLPGNILWTILFGSWLSLICYTFSVLINFVPVGGSLYARVIWELAGYLLWPFGKYVEVEVSPDSGDRTASNAEFHGTAEPVVENAFTPVAARFPHDHSHVVPFNSRPTSMLPSSHSDDRFDTLRPENVPGADAGESSGSSARRSTPRQSDAGNSTSTSPQEETSSLKGKAKAQYGTMYDGESGRPLSSMERIEAEQSVYGYVHDEYGHEVGRNQRVAGRVAFALVFGLVLFPLMGLVCLACWGMVFTIPMAKLNWVLLKNLATRPLALHFRSAPSLEKLDADADGNEIAGAAKKFFLPLKPGEPAPRLKSISAGNVTLQRRSKILLCTYRAVGVQYYKYTVGGVNILFVNTVPLVFFTIIDFFLIEKYVAHHGITSGFLAFISGQGVIFMLALGSVIPLSYFIGMAVASISAQSSIGMGAVINATFGSIIEIILYAIALTQKKARLVEGSLVGSILAGVLLMPGLSMCSGATRRKEQRFNARSAGVTSTMLIMAIIGILTPTLFYQIYGTFQLTCEGCPSDATPGDSWSCRRCFYEHVPPATDPFFQQNVRGLMYTCTVILVLSYGVGLWFSLRTHASQIWQNPLPVQQPVSTQPTVTHIPSAQRASIYKRLVPAAVMQQLLPTAADRAQGGQGSNAGSAQGTLKMPPRAGADDAPPPLKLPEHFSQEDYERAMALTASAFHNAFQQQQHQQQQHQHQANQAMPPQQRRQSMNVSQHQKHISMHEEGEDAGGHGGHDAPSWSRGTSLTVLISCTVLYAIIAEILVDVVDVVLDGSGLDEKFLGITLFALVPNTTEFMNAMSFAINGNIALSMEIGSAYALQVCLIQIPAMVVFSAYYNAGLTDGSLIHRSFTLIFPRWDVIAIIFSVFLLTYTYIESRSNYYRGTICILSYMVLVAGFYFAPPTGDTEAPGDDNRGLLLSNAASFVSSGMDVLASGVSSFTLGRGGAFGAAPSGVTRASGMDLARAGGYSSHAAAAGSLAAPPMLPHLNLAQWTYALWTSLWAR